ncbi:WXG100 family type VII secretion target [Cryobacterium sp. W22_MBD10_FK3]|uniref:WXG100 family type VII secretion target n=1 Tax=Cryobacterium sp. W22_MBD10_FK3 TaxID=3240273 RepID=UPI003F9110B8
MTQFQVDSEALITTTGSARATMARIQAEVAALLGQLTGLEGSWTGQASAQFQAAVSAWRTTQLHVEQSADALNQALGQAGQQYAEVEQANARLFAR